MLIVLMQMITIINDNDYQLHLLSQHLTDNFIQKRMIDDLYKCLKKVIRR
jgi:hypothetical protein